jgi:hypothetical protein
MLLRMPELGSGPRENGSKFDAMFYRGLLDKGCVAAAPVLLDHELVLLSFPFEE